MKGPKFTTIWMLGVFAAGCLLHWRHHPQTADSFWCAGLTVGVSGALFPKRMQWFERSWMRLTGFINKVISRFLAILIFYLVLTPLALLFRIFRRDELKLRRPITQTYWQQHEKITDVNSYKHLY